VFGELEVGDMKKHIKKLESEPSGLKPSQYNLHHDGTIEAKLDAVYK